MPYACRRAVAPDCCVRRDAAQRSSVTRQLLLTYDFPPLGGGIARMMGELAMRYPPGSLVISTGRCPGSATVDAAMSNRVHRSSIDSRRLRTVQGLVVWSRQARALARDFDPGFVWCGNLKPAGFPAAWIHRRAGAPMDPRGRESGRLEVAAPHEPWIEFPGQGPRLP